MASTSATLNTTVDPDGDATSYYFQYGTSAEYGAKIPAAPGATLGAGTSEVAVSNHIQGLTPGVVYHYRVVIARRSGNRNHGSSSLWNSPVRTRHSPRRSPVRGLVLPDERQWELVSPPDKHGAVIAPIGEGSRPSRLVGRNDLVHHEQSHRRRVPGSDSGVGAQSSPNEARPAGPRGTSCCLTRYRPSKRRRGRGIPSFSEDLSGLAEPFRAVHIIGHRRVAAGNHALDVPAP